MEAPFVDSIEEERRDLSNWPVTTPHRGGGGTGQTLLEMSGDQAVNPALPQ